jgi:hypothetical protein
VPTEPRPGEVWFADLGMVEKSRPVLVLAYPPGPPATEVVKPALPKSSGSRYDPYVAPCPPPGELRLRQVCPMGPDLLESGDVLAG